MASVGARAGVGKLLPAVSSGLRPPAEQELAVYGVDLRGVRVADIGAGEGRLALGAAADAQSVIAIDPDPDALARGRAEARRRGVQNVSFHEGAAQELDLADGSIDVVLLSWTL